jgi:dephospho-CoA kinase
MAFWVGISGGIAAGKTSVALCLADALEAPFASFGNYVRAEAARRQLAADRHSLQEVGEGLITELGWDRFCRAVLDHGGVAEGSSSAVIDGIRHVDAFEALKSIASPTPFYLVFLDVPDELRSSRLEAGGIPREEIALIERHPTERDVSDALRERASVVVSGSDSITLCRDARLALEQLWKSVLLS